jgi:hydrogenase maturation protease
VSAPATVLVCGDPARGDDGAGIAAVARMRRADRIGVDIRRVGQLEPDDLVDALAAGDCVVVDAVRGIEPGTIVEVPLRRLATAGGPQPASSHALPLATVIGLAEALGADVDRATFVGIGGNRFDLGTGLSAPVATGLDACVTAILRHVGRDGRSCA